MKIDNSGEEILKTFEGITAMDDGLQEFLEHCVDQDADQWVSEMYSNIIEGYDDHTLSKLLKWLDKNGQIHQDFLNSHYTLVLRDVTESDETEYDDYLED